MQNQTIITISRQFGSGGREIAKSLSETLSIPFYDKEIITEAAKKSGLHENLFKTAEERPTSLLYSLATGTMPMLDINETVFQIQSKVITELSQNGSCVFVGRCADYVLRSNPNACRFFIYAEPQKRLERIMQVYGLNRKNAEDLMIKTDKKRAGHYNYYTGRKWHAFENYDLCINSSKTGITGATDIILNYLAIHEQ